MLMGEESDEKKVNNTLASRLRPERIFSYFSFGHLIRWVISVAVAQGFFFASDS